MHEYLYDDGRLITEKINGYSMVFLYDESNNVDCIWYNGDKYYLIRNTFGDVVQLRDASNQVVAYYKYNAFGYLLSVTDANGAEITDTSHIAHLNPIRYRGYYYDAELKMYYLYSRYYNPEMGRFISADVLVGTSLAGTNLFAYCGNDPVNYIDPYGYCFSRTDCTCNTEDDKDGACNCRTACNFQICPPEERLQTLPDVDEPGSTNSQNSGAGSGGSSNKVNFVATKDLTPTHGLTKSRNDMKTLISDIDSNGIQEPVKYVNFGGDKYIVDGHHRVWAAKVLRIFVMPAIEVFLPYAGYTSFDDLLW